MFSVEDEFACAVGVEMRGGAGFILSAWRAHMSAWRRH